MVSTERIHLIFGTYCGGRPRASSFWNSRRSRESWKRLERRPWQLAGHACQMDFPFCKRPCSRIRAEPAKFTPCPRPTQGTEGTGVRRDSSQYPLRSGRSAGSISAVRSGTTSPAARSLGAILQWGHPTERRYRPGRRTDRCRLAAAQSPSPRTHSTDSRTPCRKPAPHPPPSTL